VSDFKVFDDHKHNGWEHKDKEHLLDDILLLLSYIGIISFAIAQVHDEVKFLKSDNSGTGFEEQANFVAVVAIYDDWDDDNQVCYGVSFDEVLAPVLRNE